LFPEGTPDMHALFQQAAQMQERLASAQQELQEKRVVGSSGGGLVQATVSGAGDLIDLTIDPTVCDPSDPEMLADLVVAAVHDAVGNAQRSAAAEVGDLTAGLGAGLGLEGLLGGSAAAGRPSADDD
jgi:nucleoid-associated protein EbfC